jgi:hypothetical protein
MNQRHMASVAEWAWSYCLQEGARTNLRASAILNQLIRIGIEARESERAAANKARRTIEAIKAIDP